MKLYEIALPTKTNAGHTTLDECADWEAEVLLRAGGFSEMVTSVGLWKDDTGKVHRDVCRRYQVACTEEIWRMIVRFAFRTFPDQLAIFHACIGEATIEDRPE